MKRVDRRYLGRDDFSLRSYREYCTNGSTLETSRSDHARGEEVDAAW